ncbi:DUF2142 domain-containing protein [Cellulomonas sp. H30R-01]|uniref:DUF2142 domain-containing protein n=1 Tax=Cellulomonas sp. H30R-01 TaxID=2704467 RepID=UPI00138BADB8|nr:DUF2142 domain-containing protein [Cellulomonas sp. H30R-01]QHT56320.1 DUF2142 domain-containing protein [Cellulomonas sp. H30R-01]
MRDIAEDIASPAPAVPGEGDDASTPRSRWAVPGARWLWAVLAVLLVAGGTWVALAQPSGAVRADVTEHFDLATPQPPVEVGEPQTFGLRAEEDGLSEVRAVLATYRDTISCDLRATLSDGDRTVATGTLDCADIPDNEAVTILAFDPVEDSAGRTYDLTLAVTDDSVIGPSVWESTTGTDSLITYYDGDDRVVDRVGLVLDRLGDYAPVWGSPAGLALGLVLVAAAAVLLVARPRWGLVALVALVLVRGLVWTTVIPPLQGMDEGAHFANAQYIAEQGKIPVWNTTEHRYGAYSESVEVATEAMHVSSHRPTDRPDYGDDAVDELRADDAAVGTDSDPTGPAASYPPTYYGPAALFYLAAPDDTVAQVHAVRLWSTLLGVAAIVFAWLFAGELLPGRRWARAGLVTAVALQPMLAHQYAIVNNDAWVVACGFAALWLGARLVRSARAPWVMLAAGAAVGLAALGKPFGAIALFPVAIGWLLGKVQHRVRDWRVLVVEPLLAGVGVACTYGLWLVVQRLLGIQSGIGFPASPEPGPRDLVTYLATQYDPAFLEFRGLWVVQLWGNFGWVNTPLPQIAYEVLWWSYLALAAAVVGWLVVVLRQWRTRTDEQRRLDRLVTLCTGTGILSLLGMYAIEYLFFASSGRTDLLQGRYLLMVVPVLLALPVLLVQRFVPRRRAATVTAWSLAAVVLLLHVVSIGVVVRHYYL